MGLKLKNSKPYSPKNRIEVLGISVPVISSLDELPLGVQAEASDLLFSLSSGNIGPTQWSVRMFCLATQLNRNPQERIVWTELSRMNLEPDEEQELISGALEVVKPLIDKMNTVAQESDPPKVGE